MSIICVSKVELVGATADDAADNAGTVVVAAGTAVCTDGTGNGGMPAVVLKAPKPCGVHCLALLADPDPSSSKSAHRFGEVCSARAGEICMFCGLPPLGMGIATPHELSDVAMMLTALGKESNIGDSGRRSRNGSVSVTVFTNWLSN